MRFNSFAGFIVLTMASIAVAQSSGDIAYFHVNRVKSGMRMQYETARKRHWVWHQKMQDTWAYHVWQIVSGEASGTYMVCSFGHTWKEVDESDLRPFEIHNSSPWEQLYREQVGQLETGACLDFAVRYHDIRKVVPRHSH